MHTRTHIYACFARTLTHTCTIYRSTMCWYYNNRLLHEIHTVCTMWQRSGCHFLADDAIKTLRVYLKLSSIYYCNSLLAGLPQSLESSESSKLCSPCCSPRTSTCSHHSNTQTSSLVARQSLNFLQDCMPLFQHHHLLHPCLSLWLFTFVLSFLISSLQCRHPPPQNSTL